MAITEIKVITRPNTTVPFFGRSAEPASLEIRRLIAPFLLNNTLNWNVAVSDDGLTQTATSVFDSLETYSQIRTLSGIELDYAFRNYVEGADFVPPTSKQYTQSGIDSKFTCTTTYSYNPDTISTDYPLWDSFIGVIEASDKLINLTNTGTDLIATHQYLNSEDYTENYWLDYRFINGLHDGHVVRTVAFEMV